MIPKKNSEFLELKKLVSKEAKIIREINILMRSFQNSKGEEDKVIFEQVEGLKTILKETNDEIPELLDKVVLVKPLREKEILRKKDLFFYHRPEGEEVYEEKKSEEIKLSELEKETIKRIKNKEGVESKKKIKKPNMYISFANGFFSDYSERLSKLNIFKSFGRDLVKANMEFMARSYISVMLLTTIISFFVGAFIFIFFMFFSITPVLPIIQISAESFLTRFLKIFWIPIIFPIGTFLFMYFYPGLERDSIGQKIDRELPFATINMAAISGSFIEPTKIFSIIISTGEYPNLEKEFIRVVNNVNVLGQDLVSSLRNSAANSASKKLVELLNGLATNLTSGGDMFRFFEERAKTLLFEYNLEKEKETRASETFMDIYISVVIAAPMIIMLLLLMMRISGLGLALSTNTITLIMVMGVSLINVVFLAFLSLRQQGGA
jgi:hypothetical protein